MSGNILAPFPLSRPRRLRRTPWVRDLVREHDLTANDLILPLFVREGAEVEEPIASMPGVSRLSVDRVAIAAERAADLGIPCVALFPILRRKNAQRTARKPGILTTW